MARRFGSLRYDVGMPSCQQKNCCALTTLDGNDGGKPRALPGRCPGRSCGGLSGLVSAPPFGKKEAMDLPLTERLRGCDTADLEVCATTIGRANPQIAGFRPGGGPRAEARVGAVDEASTAPHARARALPETNPGSEWPQPDSTGNSAPRKKPNLGGFNGCLRGNQAEN
jgi:hypothetical protein